MGYTALEPRPRRTMVAALCAAAAAAVIVARAGGAVASAEAPLAAAALGSDRSDDDAAYESIQTVVTTYNASRMKLYARVRVTLRSARAADAPFIGAVQYAPEYGDDDDSDPLLPLWTPNATFGAASDGSGALSAEFHVFRLRPATRYAFRVWVSAGGGAAARSDVAYARVPATGWARFDEAPLAAVSGGVPQWQTLTMAYALKVRGHRDVHFNGIVAVDQAGWVVWYYAANFNRTVGGHGGAPGAWDFLPAADGYAMVLLEVGYADPFATSDGRRWRANSALLQVRDRALARGVADEAEASSPSLSLLPLPRSTRGARSRRSTCRRARARRSTTTSSRTRCASTTRATTGACSRRA